MPIAVTCTQCQKNFRVADNFAGKQGRCPQCNFVLIVPNPEARGNLKPFGETEGPPPPPRRERPEEPPPRRRPERDERDDDEERPPRRPERDRDRDRDRGRDDDYDDRPPRDQTPRSWQIVGLGRPLLMYESILSLVGRGCFLLGAILVLVSDPYGRDSITPMLAALALVGMTTILASSIFGLVGKLSTRFAPDRIARSEGGVSAVLALVALGVLLILELYFALVLADRNVGYRPRGIPGSIIVVMAMVLIGMCLSYTSDLFLARFFGRVGQLARNRALAGWGPILTIYLICLMGYAAVTFLVIVMASGSGGELVMIMFIILLAVDYGGAVMCLLPRPRLARALRQLHESGPTQSGNDRFDEDEDEEDNRSAPPRDRRRYRDEEYD